MRTTSLIRTSLFLTMLWLPLAAWIFGIPDPVPIRENRMLAEAPDARALFDPERFLHQFDLYYADHFGFRSSLIFGQNVVRVLWLGGSPTRHVTLGKDGWMFLGSVDEIAHQKVLSQNELAARAEALMKRRAAYAAEGIDYRILVIPTSDGVYRDYWPDEAAAQPITNAYDRFAAYWKAHESGVLIDAKDALLKNRYYSFPSATGSLATTTIYYKYDSHWNNLGTFIGLQTLMQTLHADYPCITAPSASDFEPFISDAPETTADQLALGPLVHERAYFLRVRGEKNPTCKTKILIVGDSMVEHSLAEWLPKLGYRSAFVHKDAGPQAIEQRISASKPDVLIDERQESRFEELFN